jgi:ketosteroid isomerase-like protein
MTSANTQTQSQTEIRALIDSWLNAVRAKDVDRIVSHYAADIVAFDAVLALQFKGVAAYKAHWQKCMTMCPPGEMVFEIGEPNIAAENDLAFCYALVRCGVAAPSGEESASWSRMTAGYRRENGKWRVVHEHFSMPFDVENSKVLLDLKP